MEAFSISDLVYFSFNFETVNFQLLTFRVRVYTTGSGRSLLQLGMKGRGNGQLERPISVAWDSQVGKLKPVLEMFWVVPNLSINFTALSKVKNDVKYNLKCL